MLYSMPYTVYTNTRSIKFHSNRPIVPFVGYSALETLRKHFLKFKYTEVPIN